MTSLWRTLVLTLAGLGTVWAVTRVGGVPPTVFNTLEDTAPSAPAADPPPAPAPAPAPALAEGVAPSPADIDAQIRQAEEALGERADPNQELPVDPLRADVAIALPSDI